VRKRAIVTDSKEPFTEIYDEHVWDVYGFLAYRSGSRETAEDLTQTTFERALRAWRSFDPKRGSARTWLLAIAQNALIDQHRREATVRLEPLDDGDGGRPARIEDGPEESSLGISPELDAAIQALSDRERHLIALRFGGDLTGPEIADLTGLTLANVQQILSRSLRRLRAELEPERAAARLG
jgi:RNA polymerase sigma factor (sigma-70 family)